MEGLVYGWKIYKDIEKKLEQKNPEDENKAIECINKLLDEAKIKKSKAGKFNDNKPDIKTSISDLRNIMTKKVGILRDAQSLKEAREFVDFQINSRCLYNKRDKNILEFANMLTVASLIIKAASLREESRGTHQRNDFPYKDDKNWKKHIILKQNKVYFKDV